MQQYNAKFKSNPAFENLSMRDYTLVGESIDAPS